MRGIWSSAWDFYQSRSSALAAICVTCGGVAAFEVWVLELLPCSPRDWEEAKRLVLSHKMKWSVQLCASAITGGSPNSTLLGVRYKLERHAGIIRNPSLLKKLRNSHELHSGRWINRPLLELWEDFFLFFFSFFFYLSKRLFCLEPPFNCLWMSFSWFGLMLLVFQMLMPFYTDGKSNFKVHLRCYCVESYNWQVKLGCFCKSADVYKLVLILNSTFFLKNYLFWIISSPR